jgi:hypothetical protein
VALVDNVEEPVEQLARLLGRDAVDVLDVAADGEDGLPPCDGVGADDGMDGLELGADVLGGAAGLVVEGEAGLFGDLVEGGLLEGDGEGLEELLVRLADAVVDLIARCPEGVWRVSSRTGRGKGGRGRTAAGPGQLDETKGGVVRGNGLKGDIAVPLRRVLALGAQLVLGGLGVELLVLDGADGADLRVLAAELALRVEDGVDVEGVCGGAACELAETADELLLQLVGEVVLGAEEDDAALRDWGKLAERSSV